MRHKSKESGGVQVTVVGRTGFKTPSFDESALRIQITKNQGWRGNGDNSSDPGGRITKKEGKGPMSHQQMIAAKGREGHGLMTWDSELRSLRKPRWGNKEQKQHLCSREFQKVWWDYLSSWGGIGHGGDVQIPLGMGHEESRNDLGFHMEMSGGGLLWVELWVLMVDRQSEFPLPPAEGWKDSGKRQHPRQSLGREYRDQERGAPFSGTGTPDFKHSGFTLNLCQWARKSQETMKDAS